MTMKRNWMFMVVAAVAWMAAAQTAVPVDEHYRQAVQGALTDAQAALRTAAIPADAAVAILPVAGDQDGWIAGQLKIALTAAGKRCVEGKEDPMWNEILKEITWDTRKADMLDPATVDRFGKLKSAQVLLYAFIRGTSRNERCVFFEVELHATSIAEKRHLWGGIFAKRYYIPASGTEEKGLTDIPVSLRNVMQGKFREAIIASIKGAPKLAGVKRVAFLPFAGDRDHYAADIMRDALARTELTTVNLDIATPTEARLALRDKPDQADALLYGSLRELSMTPVSTLPTEKKYTLTAEIQVCIEKAATREQLWSDTICVSEPFTPEYGWWERLCTLFPALRGKPFLAVVIPLAIVIVLVVVRMFIKAATRVR